MSCALGIEGLADRYAGIYEAEWQDVLNGETKSYRTTVSAIGGLVNDDLVAISERLAFVLSCIDSLAADVASLVRRSSDYLP